MLFERRVEPEYEEIWNIMLGGRASSVGKAFKLTDVIKNILKFIVKHIIPLVFYGVISSLINFAIADVIDDGLLFIISFVLVAVVLIGINVAKRFLSILQKRLLRMAITFGAVVVLSLILSGILIIVKG